MYVYCVVCYHVIAAPSVRSGGCVFAHIYTLVDDSEHPWVMVFLHHPVFSPDISVYMCEY